mmetsp:Transcript_28138/g.67080  ORF Transcript_28138/g.67080 Transcript_28138/m.67080 type:complete len:98 (-) Transcript_28138:60-353(-)
MTHGPELKFTKQEDSRKRLPNEKKLKSYYRTSKKRSGTGLRREDTDFFKSVDLARESRLTDPLFACTRQLLLLPRAIFPPSKSCCVIKEANYTQLFN